MRLLPGVPFWSQTCFVMGVMVALGNVGCDQFKATTNRAFGNFSSSSPSSSSESTSTTCPSAVPGRAAGTSTSEEAFTCFQTALQQKSPELLLRVTCQGTNTATCKQTDRTERDAKQVMTELSALSWQTVLGRWDIDKTTVAYAIDTFPKEKKVSTVTLCRIVEGDRWAVCDLGETSRENAMKKKK